MESLTIINNRAQGLKLPCAHNLKLSFNMNNNDIKRRLLFIIDDASRLLQHLESGRDMDEFTGFADDGYTHLSNIQIASNLEDNESDAWKSVYSMDTKTLELITLNFSK